MFECCLELLFSIERKNTQTADPTSQILYSETLNTYSVHSAKPEPYIGGRTDLEFQESFRALNPT